MTESHSLAATRHLGLEQAGLAVGVPAPCESPPSPGLMLKGKGRFRCSFPAGGRHICQAMTRVSA